MILLSAQPDDPYFIWQLEIQILNFREFGFAREQIHVLVGYDEDHGINYLFSDFFERYSDKACFFKYPDENLNRKYIPSIRPHIIKKHFLVHRHLCDEIIFYHDCDILFTHALPDFERLCNDDNWYFSDTRKYLDSNYIKKSGTLVFKEMCLILNIDEEIVLSNDKNAGGAQALLKGVSFDFWDRIEQDCDALFYHLTENRSRFVEAFKEETQKNESDYLPINTWYTDMWALLWNSLKIANVRIDSELDFCWPNDNIKEWQLKKIFHNAGVGLSASTRLFFKQNYKDKNPYHSNFDFVQRDRCSYHYVARINELKKARRFTAKDCVIILNANLFCDSDRLSLNFTINYFYKFFQTRIVVICTRKSHRFSYLRKMKFVDLICEQNDEDLSKKLLAYLENNAYPIVTFLELNIIVSPELLYRAILSIRHNTYDVNYPHNGSCYNVSKTVFKINSLNYDMDQFLKFGILRSETQMPYYGIVVTTKNNFENTIRNKKTTFSSKYQYLESYIRFSNNGLRIQYCEGSYYLIETAGQFDNMPPRKYQTIKNEEMKLKYCIELAKKENNEERIKIPN